MYRLICFLASVYAVCEHFMKMILRRKFRNSDPRNLSYVCCATDMVNYFICDHWIIIITKNSNDSLQDMCPITEVFSRILPLLLHLWLRNRTLTLIHVWNVNQYMCLRRTQMFHVDHFTYDVIIWSKCST